MTPERWSKIEQLYHAASVLDAGARAEFLDNACGADIELRQELESLLRCESKAAEFLESHPEASKEGAELPAAIGHYRVTSRIGAGGMGEVFRAQDTKLGRDVALKMLRRDLAFHPERLARFRREARLLAALNHPNIGAIYEIEESEGTTCLVLELVEGESLRGPLPVKQALEYARQLAEALEAAHSQGIVHRDLKPANILITPQGRLKVLDFGLAKALSGPDPSPDVHGEGNAAVLDTMGGLIAGTPAYMSPEQARGAVVDQRADIWAFGCVLYELLSGKRAFGGDALPETSKELAQTTEPGGLVGSRVPGSVGGPAGPVWAFEEVRGREPDWTALPKTTPGSVRNLIRRCLEKDVSRRLQNIPEVRGVLEGALRQRARWPLAIAASLVTVVAISAAGAWRMKGNARSNLQPKPLTSYPGPELFPALSPDGQTVAFTWTGGKGGQVDLYIRPVDSEPARGLTSDPALECYPAWSPDGTLIAFLHCDGNMGGIRTEAEVYVIRSSGGAKRKVGKVFLRAYDNAPALAWMPDGKKLVVRNGRSTPDPVGLSSLDIETGEMRQLTSPPRDWYDLAPAVSEDGRMLAFVRQATGRQGEIFVQDLMAGTASLRQITHEGNRIFGVAWRHRRELLYLAEAGTARILWRMESDGSKRERLAGGGQVGLQFSVSRDGRRIAYSDGFIDADIARVDLSAAHKDAPLHAAAFIASTQWDGAPNYSPDGRKIAFASARSGHIEIWMAEEDGSNPKQLTFQNSNTGSPRWSPRGDEIAFDLQEGKRTDIHVVAVNSRQTRKITSDPGSNFLPSWSRDGNWVYFVSDRHDGHQVWKAPAHASNGEPAIQVTRQGGFFGQESFDGQHFYYAKTPDPSCVWMVAANGGGETEVVCPLISWHYIAVFPDGIYYVPRTSSDIWFFRFANQRAQPAFRLEKGAGGAFSFSPDRRWLLISQAELRGDLYLLTDFD